MIRQAVAAVTAALVVSSCSPSDDPSTAERPATTTTTTTTTPEATTPPVGGERQLCTNLAAVDLSNPQELLKIQVPRTTVRAFDLPLAFLVAKLTALESALNAGTNPAYPTQEAATAVTNVLDVCRQRGYL
jgi:hypothetical protein